MKHFFTLVLSTTLFAQPLAVVADIASPPMLTAVGFTVEKDFNHNRPLLLESQDSGDTWTKALLNLVNVPTSGVFEKTSCSGYGQNPVCIAVGSQDEYKMIPLLAVKSSSNAQWLVKYLKSHGALFGASCTGKGANAVCAVGLQDFIAAPFLVVSVDGGNRWYKKNIAGLSADPNIELTALSCTGEEPNVLCSAIGAQTLFDNHEFTGFKPIIAVGNGHKWSVKSVSSFTDNMLLSDVSCTGEGKTATCVAIGSAAHDSPAVIVSNDGGETWAQKVIDDLPKSSELKHVSCTGSGDNTVCSAVGGTLIDPMGKYSALIVVSTNNGETWSIKPVDFMMDDTEYSKELLSIQCKGKGEHATCVAVGFKELPDANADSESTGIIVVSTDGGRSWQNKWVVDLPFETNFFSNISCTRTDMKTVCTAVGGADGKPMIAISHDNGNQWSVSRSLIGLQLRNGVLLDTASSN